MVVSATMDPVGYMGVHDDTCRVGNRLYYVVAKQDALGNGEFEDERERV